ncbi:MAG: serine hydrolase domain-containing protein [Candidatus Saliniplasma sp.]
MNKEGVRKSIEDAFRNKVKRDSKINNAYLLVHSDKLGLHLNIAEGSTEDTPADSRQPNYMASVGKLFTSTLVSMLYDEGKLSFDDSISEYLDDDVLDGLHVYKGDDYTDKIRIKHLLNHTSGLPDSFWHLLDKLLENPDIKMNPRKAIEWGKKNRKPHFPPGDKFHYTDTNYYLLGFIVEELTRMPFHEVLKERIFRPLDMKHSYMLNSSEPMEDPGFPIADFYLKGKKMTGVKVFNDTGSYAGIDYAGGGVVAPMGDLLKFMKSIVNHEIIKKETLDLMMKDKAKFGLGIDYGYGIWMLKKIPILMPEKFKSWGVVGATGAFMFYHPELEAYFIGNLNDTYFERKGVRFMLKIMDKVIKSK